MKFIDDYKCSLTTRNLIRLLLIILLACIINLYILRTTFATSSLSITLKNESILIRTLTLQKQKKYCIVYITSCAGRFGNQMFLIASVYGLARLHSCYIYIPSDIIKSMNEVFIFDLSPLLISTSRFNESINNLSQPMNKTDKFVVCEYIPELTRPNAISHGSVFELTGFWQSYLHFAKYSDELRERIFVSTKPVLEKISNFFIYLYKEKLGLKPDFLVENHHSFKKELSQSNLITWIGIHIRRSDFLQHGFSSSDEYLFNAIEYYTSLYQNTYFIVASDDKSYCENLFHNRSNIFITSQSFSLGEDLIILSLCEHSIITGGTYGWWTGYLANGQVIHDKVYPSGCERREYYYPPWFLIDGHVRAHKNSNYTL